MFIIEIISGNKKYIPLILYIVYKNVIIFMIKKIIKIK
jgi:hypothetical protein